MMQHYLANWKKFATFTGRARRSEYWWFTLINTAIYLLLAMIGASLLVGGGETVGMMGAIPMIIAYIFIFAALIPSLASGVRRMHDVGKSGWYLLIPIYSIILAFTDSQPGTNKWGPNPKGIGGGVAQAADHLVS